MSPEEIKFALTGDQPRKLCPERRQQVTNDLNVVVCKDRRAFGSRCEEFPAKLRFRR